MKKYISPFFICIFFIALLPSCKSVKTPEIKGIEKVKINRLGLVESNISFEMLFFNPNNYRIKLKEAQGDAWLDGNPLGHFTVDTLIQIPAKGDFRLPVRLKMNMRYIIENISAAFMDKRVNLKVDGMAKAGKGFVFINYPIQFEGKQNLSELLK